MNKTAIKNFAVWARNKLIADISYRAGLIGITERGIASALPQSTGITEFYDIGTAEPYSISGDAVRQRRRLVELIERKEKETDYKTAYKYIIEEVAYTWFNRLIAIRFMEVNDYLPSHIRVLSSESGKMEPDLVTTPFDADLSFSKEEEQLIIQLKQDNKLDDLFRLLFIKQCNELNEILPALFEKTKDYTELLLSLSFVDQEGVVARLIKDIPEDDFNMERDGQVEIIGWLYQYYITEKHEEVVNISSKGPVKKENIPAATQLFTTDWVVRYLVDNSLGRYWIERNKNSELADELEYYVEPKVDVINEYIGKVNPEEITFLDPAVGSGHFLSYAFDVLLKIYEECGYAKRDAVVAIVENNLYGLDIDNRATQLAYFSIMMKARQHDRRFFGRGITPAIYTVEESNHIETYVVDYFCNGDKLLQKSLDTIIREMHDAKEYGSIISVSMQDWEAIYARFNEIEDDINICQTLAFQQLLPLIKVAELIAKKYTIVATNPPYLNKYNDTLKKYVIDNYKDYSADLFSVFMYRNTLYAKHDGYIGFMTPFVWMYIKSYEKLRSYIIDNKGIVTLIQMEYSAYEEATVPICAFVLTNNRNILVGDYFDLSKFVGGMNVQREKVLEALRTKNCSYWHSFYKNDFKRIDGAPIAFMASEKLLTIFESAKPLKDIAEPKVGLQTGNNDAFLRLWYEVSFEEIGLNLRSLPMAKESGRKWFPYNKGGDFRRWYGNRNYVVDWYDDGYGVKHCFNDLGKLRSRPQNVSYYMKPCITWSDITSASFSGRYCEGGFIFDVKGSSAFPKVDNLLYVLGFLNSKISQRCIKILNPTITTQVGDMARIPVYFDKDSKEKIDTLVKECVEISKEDWNEDETSWDFVKHPLLRSGSRLREIYFNWEQECMIRHKKLKANEEELNQIFIDIYGLSEELNAEVTDKSVEASCRYANVERGIKSLISYAVGCMFGRYSLDKSGLAYSGGIWDDSLYTSFIPDRDNCIPITDEEYFEDDILGRFCEWLKKAYGTEYFEDNLDFIAQTLGGKGNTSREIIRNYFLNEFFKDHSAMYSITGSGKRPIYWLFDSGKQNGFKALVYVHRWNADTIGNLRIDYLHRVQRIYESEINRMQDMIDHSTNAREVATATKRKEKLQKQLKECREYDEKIGHLALSRIDIDLDDGVKVNYEKVQTASDGKKYQVLAKI